MDADTHNALEMAIEVGAEAFGKPGSESRETMTWELVSACSSLEMSTSADARALALLLLLGSMDREMLRELRRETCHLHARCFTSPTASTPSAPRPR